jgi:predicted peroxiredoxin
MLTLKQGIKLSAIIDKLDLKITDPKASQEKIGADLMMQIISKAHKAEQEIYAFVAETKGITVKEAENVDLMQFIKDLVSDAGVVNFFKSAVT